MNFRKFVVGFVFIAGCEVNCSALMAAENEVSIGDLPMAQLPANTVLKLKQKIFLPANATEVMTPYEVMNAEEVRSKGSCWDRVQGIFWGAMENGGASKYVYPKRAFLTVLASDVLDRSRTLNAGLELKVTNVYLEPSYWGKRVVDERWKIEVTNRDESFKATLVFPGGVQIDSRIVCNLQSVIKVSDLQGLFEVLPSKLS